jgi:photosystem II stability/assembly factor-like uncharacterized protein
MAVAATVLGSRARARRRQIVLYAVAAALTLAVVLGFAIAMTQPRGAWEPIHTLISGPTYLVAADPADPQVLYAVTSGGPGPREGSSLFVRRAGEWTLFRRDFTRGTPSGFAIVKSGDTRIFYAAVAGIGLLRSHDGGMTWETSNSGLTSRGITSLVVDPREPKTLYLSTNDWRGVLRSTDGGESWEDYDTTGEMYGAVLQVLAFTPADGGALLAGTADGRILKHRTDGGNWEATFGLSQGSVNTIIVASWDGMRIYAGTDRGIVLRSTDAGENFDILGQVSDGQNVQFRIASIAALPSDPAVVYACAFGNGGYTLWRSPDSGQHWDIVPGIGLPRTGAGLSILPGASHLMFIASTGEGLFTSEDDGKTWRKEAFSAPLAPITSLAVSPQSEGPVYAASGASIYASNDGHLKDWSYGVGLRAQIVRAVVADPGDPNTAYAGVLLLGEWSVFVTHDGGQTWAPTDIPEITPGVPDTTALAVAGEPDKPATVYAGTSGCGLLRSDDGGKSWDTYGRDDCGQVTASGMPADIAHLAVSPNNRDALFAATGQRFYASPDGGRTWASWSIPLSSSITGIAADPIDTHTVYMTTGSDGVWRSNDSGANWKRCEVAGIGKAELASIAAIPGKRGHLVIGATNGEVWMTTDGGTAWHSIRENLAVSSISTIATSAAFDGGILAGSAVDGLARFTPNPLFSHMAWLRN